MERQTPPPPGAGLQGPTLVGLLAQLALVDRPAVPPSFVEGMGRWLGWQSAIALSAALQATPGVVGTAGKAPGRTAGSPPAAEAATLARAFDRVRDTLTQAIVDDHATAAERGLDFVPFRRRYHQLQQAMAAAIQTLRTQLRAALAQRSPSLGQLAALDAVMADALAPREQAQLAQMSALLDKHFNRLRQGQTDPQPDTSWLDTFRQDMRRMLLAELALRMQPAQGLLDTLRAPLEEHHEHA